MPPPELLRFAARDWHREDPVPEQYGSDAERVWSYRAGKARRRWSDAGFGWAHGHGFSDREWLTLRHAAATARPRS